MLGITVAIAAFVVTVVALLVVSLLTMRTSRAGSLDNVFVSRGWLMHYREKNKS